MQSACLVSASLVAWILALYVWSVNTVVNEIIFYNGFNLLIDIVLIVVVALVFHGIGYRKAKRNAERKYKGYFKPPF
jgi:heme/copper-type cytochrome/quinol oxidase subunit 2